MKVRLLLGTKFKIGCALSALFAILCAAGLFPIKKVEWVCVIMTFLYICALEIKFTSRAVASLTLPLAGALVSFFTGQQLLGLPISMMSFQTALCNLVLLALIYFVVLTVLESYRVSFAVCSISLFILHFVNYAVYSFRGWELTVSDFYSIKNAIGVADRYKIVLTKDALLCFAALALALFFVFVAKFPEKKHKWYVRRIPALAGSVVCLIGVFLGIGFSSNTIQHFGFNGTLFNGATWDFVVELRESRVTPEDSYSASHAEFILSRYVENETTVENPPHVIVIMSESFADLSVLGEFPMQGEDPYEFFNSLSENTVRGNAISSVFGGSTANSEWEFLTGNSAAFIPQGSIAYQQYITDHAWSLVDVFNDESYTTVAMHPYTREFWKRNVVYDIMGFDEMWFQDELTSADKLRGFITDRSFYSDIITRFEQRQEGERMFMFNITMQNHGGYKWGDFEASVTTGNPEWADVDQYLSLVKLSDDALRDLVTYFEGVDEPVMLVLFGDHHPSLTTDFYSSIFKTEYLSLDDQMKKQTVPFIIWTNYEQESSTGELVGLNSLAALVLDRAGIATPPYFSFLSAMREDIPAFSAFGYWSRESERFVEIADASGVEAAWIDDYRILQYNNLFDKAGRLEAFK